MRRAIGLDIGGTKIAALLVTEDGEVQARHVVSTPADDAMALISAAVGAAEAVRTSDVIAIGAGVPGMVDHRTGLLRYAPNLAARELRVGERIAEATQLPCAVDNDANVAAWGEFLFGSGRGSNHMLMITVGTGIGGGIVADGRLFRGSHGFAGEIGHVIVDPEGPVCGCGNRGCWEQVASGRAIERLGKEAIDLHPESLLAQLAGRDRTKVNGTLVTEAARRGDDLARSLLVSVGRRLGQGIAGLVNILDPDVVVVGGGVVLAADMLLGPARVAFRESVEAFSHRTEVPILSAQLGNDAGAIGAAAMALEECGP